MAEKGRSSFNQRQKFQNTITQASAAQAILEKQDQIIDAIKALTAKMDSDSGDTGGDSNYASSISDSLDKVSLK